MRRMAYSDGSLLVGPIGDPIGWKVLSPVQVKGTLFNAKEVEVTCTVSVSYFLFTSFDILITTVSYCNASEYLAYLTPVL